MMSAATKQWQHTDCWRATAPITLPESPKNNTRRP
jgi:hypothetical protein